jgi:hypothetical protein
VIHGASVPGCARVLWQHVLQLLPVFQVVRKEYWGPCTDCLSHCAMQHRVLSCWWQLCHVSCHKVAWCCGMHMVCVC